MVPTIAWATKRWHHGKCVGIKICGRFQFAGSSAHNNVGRSWIRGFYASSTHPMKGNIFSGWLTDCCTFWHQFMKVRPPCRRGIHQGLSTHFRMWVDASGVERGLGALMFDGNKFEYCHCTLPQDVWEQLNPRGDHNTGSQEMVAAVMGLQTWKDKFAGHCLSFFGDNAGVVGSMIRGPSKAREINARPGRMWMHIACGALR